MRVKVQTFNFGTNSFDELEYSILAVIAVTFGMVVIFRACSDADVEAY